MNAQTQAVTRIENPLSNGQNQVVHHHSQSNSALVSTESQRAIAEVQAALAIAKSFPRDRVAAVDRILNDCQRSGLAQVAIYQYARGGTSISGPTIRLAESLAQNWGNIQYGVRELSQANGESTVEAFAWDVETNTRQTKIFQVPHVRYTKSGGAIKLIDPRDIYEAVANNGARRLRACILGVIPGDIVEAALQQCDLTLNTYADTSPEGIQKIIKAFEKYGVSKEALEKRIQCRMESIKPAQIVSLTKIGTSLKEGMSTPADWFEIGLSSGTTTQENKEDQSDFAALKHRILIIKSIDDLNACEEQVMDHTNKDERKQLMQLIKAQSQKLQPKNEANDQNSASNDVEEKTISTKKPEPEKEEAPPAEEVQAKKPTSAELRKEYLVSMNKAKNLEELDLAYRPSVIKGGLTVAHEAYLKSTYLQLKEKFKPAVQPVKEEQQTSVVNEIKSNAIAGGLKTSIQDAPNLEVMAEIAQTIRDNKPNLTTDHMAEILQVYGARKTFLENQQDMFEEDTDVTWTDSAIKRIEAAKNQDDINAVYLDPEHDEQSDKDKQRLDIASQKREAELFG